MKFKFPGVKDKDRGAREIIDWLNREANVATIVRTPRGTVICAMVTETHTFDGIGLSVESAIGNALEKGNPL